MKRFEVPAEAQVFGVPRLAPALPANMDELPGEMSNAQASNDFTAMDITDQCVAYRKNAV